MAEFVGNDRIEGKAFVYKEYPDVGMIILQVGERLAVADRHTVGGVMGPVNYSACAPTPLSQNTL